MIKALPRFVHKGRTYILDERLNEVRSYEYGKKPIVYRGAKAKSFLKKAKPIGWRNESARHSLARKGIKTGKTGQKKRAKAFIEDYASESKKQDIAPYGNPITKKRFEELMEEEEPEILGIDTIGNERHYLLQFRDGREEHYVIREKQASTGKKIFVGDLGEATISKSPKAIPVYYIREEDGSKSWQLNPDEVRGDVILKTAKAIPIEPLEE